LAKRSRTSGRRFRFSFAVVAAVLLLAGAGLLLAFKLGAGGPLLSGGDDLAAGGAQVATGPFRTVENTVERITQMWRVTERVQGLERENRDLRLWRDLAQRLAERNARYEALLKMPPDAFGAGADMEQAIGAQLVMDSGGPFTRTLVANAGAEHGVRIGYVAVNEHGLVGRVVSVGRRSSRVLLLDDYNSRIPVMGAQSRVRALLRGEAAAQAPSLATTRPFELESPRLEFFSPGLREGETIITSGDGGLFPRGLRVGVARRAGNGEWRVALAASQQTIDFVRLAPFARPDAPERSGEVAAAELPLTEAMRLSAPSAPPAAPSPQPAPPRVDPPAPAPAESLPPPPSRAALADTALPTAQ
jgi:rod shape-determining protein MreC